MYKAKHQPALPPFFTLENRKTLIGVQLHSTCELDSIALVTNWLIVWVNTLLQVQLWLIIAYL